MAPEDNLPKILNETGLKMIEGKHTQVEGLLIGGKKLLIIYIADQELTLTIYKEQMLKEVNDYVSFNYPPIIE